MAVERAHRAMPDLYFELVKAFPLTPIRDDAHLAGAQATIDAILARGDDVRAGGAEYLAVLADLVEAFEDEHYPTTPAPVPSLLRELMRSNGLTQAKLATEVGIVQSTISAILNGSRSPTTKQAEALGRRFNLDPGVFRPR